MQCHSLLQRPLRLILQSIGEHAVHDGSLQKHIATRRLRLNGGLHGEYRSVLRADSRRRRAQFAARSAQPERSPCSVLLNNDVGLRAEFAEYVSRTTRTRRRGVSRTSAQQRALAEDEGEASNAPEAATTIPRRVVSGSNEFEAKKRETRSALRYQYVRGSDSRSTFQTKFSQRGRLNQRKEERGDDDYNDWHPILTMLNEHTLSTSHTQALPHMQDADNIDDFDVGELEDAIDDLTNVSLETASHVSAPKSSSQTYDPRSFAEMPKRPYEWTCENLVAYVKDVIDPLVHHQRRYSNSKAISAELLSVFTDEAVFPSMTAEAVDRCFDFLTSTRGYDQVGTIFLWLENRSYVFTASNFDSLLVAAAKQRSFRNFEHGLHCMLTRGFQPSTIVWTSLYDLVASQNSEDGSTILEAMRSKGVLEDDDAVQHIATTSVGFDLESHLITGGALESFLDGYEAKLGPRSRWLVPSVTHKMVNSLLNHDRADDAFSVVTEMDEIARRTKRRAIEADTINVFLAIAARKQDSEAAIAYLQRFRSILSTDASVDHGSDSIGTSRVNSKNELQADGIASHLNDVSYYLLFILAQKRHLFNFLRVLWRYACLSGNVHWQMQKQMKENLKTHVLDVRKKSFLDIDLLFKDSSDREVGSDPSAFAKKEFWALWSAKYAIGVKEGLQPHDSKATGSTSDESVPTSSNRISPLAYRLVREATQVILPQNLKSRSTKLDDILNDDLEACDSLRPSTTFAKILDAALRKDMEWKQSGLGLPKGANKVTAFDRMMREGIEVPMMSKGTWRKTKAKPSVGKR